MAVADLAECERLQFDEISLLKSMYSDRELIFPEEHCSLNDACVTQLELRVVLAEVEVEIVVQFTKEYPFARPSVFVRCQKAKHVHLNKELRSFVNDHPLGEPFIMNIVNWTQENIAQFLTGNLIEYFESEKVSAEESTPEEVTYARVWIYLHHLYSNEKRRNLEAIGKELKLNGFSMAGKPGAMVIEGVASDCDAFWERIRPWKWQRCVIKHREVSKQAQNFLKMGKFRELALSSANGRTPDLSELKKYLGDLQLGYGFGILFSLCSA